MVFSKSAFVAVAMLGASTANAHIIMTNPVPYGHPNNSPLEPHGEDFPCKQPTTGYQIVKENVIQIGQDHPLSFQGTAVHGGGSCQISLTTDRKPTKQSNWQVIKSFEGGCPINAEANLPGSNPQNNIEPPLNFSIPEGIDPGKYTLAWTWFNRIGNREMYMNCAPVTVTGGSSKRDEVAVEKRSPNFPPMFVANINGCSTTEGVDIRFPNPGDNVQYLGEPKNLAAMGDKACEGTPTFGAGGNQPGSGGSGGGPSPTSGSAPGVTVSASIGGGGISATIGLGGGDGGATSAPGSTGAPGVFASGASSIAPAAPTQEPPAPAASSAPVPSSSGSSSSSGALTGPCSPDGTWNCIGGTSFQRCASGQWSQTQQMASGTKCNAGQMKELSVSASSPLKPRLINEMRFRRRVHGGHQHA